MFLMFSDMFSYYFVSVGILSSLLWVNLIFFLQLIYCLKLLKLKHITLQKNALNIEKMISELIRVDNFYFLKILIIY